MKKRSIPSRSDSVFTNRNLNRIAVLGALSMFLSTIEYLFPKPIPFMRLGLANMPLLLGLEVLDLPSFFMLVIIKVLGQALVNGTLASYVFLFSMSGSFASAAVMVLSFRLLKKRISCVGISVLGALASNIVQISLSIYFIFGSSAWKILPSFLGIGLISGFLMGIFTGFYSEHSAWWAAFSGTGSLVTGSGHAGASFFSAASGHPKSLKKRKKRRDLLSAYVPPAFRFWTGIIIIPACLFLREPLARLILLAFFILLTLLSGKRIRFGYYVMLILSITVFNLLSPSGKVLYAAGPFKITDGALVSGLMKGVSLCSLIMISLFSVSGALRLPGRLGGLLARSFYFLERLFEMKVRLVRGKIIQSLDEVLLELFAPSELDRLFAAENQDGAMGGRFSAGILYAAAVALPVWGIFLLQLGS